MEQIPNAVILHDEDIEILTNALNVYKEQCNKELNSIKKSNDNALEIIRLQGEIQYSKTLAQELEAMKIYNNL